MTIDEVYRFCNFVINKEQQGSITPDQFNVIAPVAQMSAINDRIGNIKKYKSHDPIPPYAGAINQKITEELRPITKLDTIFRDATTFYGGTFPYPPDCLYILSAQSEFYTVTFVNGFDEITKLISNTVKPPTTKLPIGCIYGEKILIAPTIPSFDVTYYRRPATPRRNYTMSNDRDVYAATGGIIGDGTSQDFEISDLTHLEICHKILQIMGINLSIDRVVAYSMNEELKGS